MRIFNSLNSNPDHCHSGNTLAAAAGNGSVNWAHFVGTESHGKFLQVLGEVFFLFGQTGRYKLAGAMEEVAALLN